jgi:hypothetical protein
MVAAGAADSNIGIRTFHDSIKGIALSGYSFS